MPNLPLHRQVWADIILGVIGGLVLIVIYAFWIVTDGFAQDELIPPTPAEAEDIKTWIPVTCCWSNSCCFKVKPTAVTQVTQDQYRINITGQVIKRTGWSKDGQTWRCTCDMIDGKWTPHPAANTRCLFPQPLGY